MVCQVLQRFRDAVLSLDLLTMLNEGVEVENMIESGSFDFRQFQVSQQGVWSESQCVCVCLQGRLDLGRAAIMGHSFGGATTIQTLSQDQRFLSVSTHTHTHTLSLSLRCGIALDCWMLPIHRDLLETGLQQPLLFINSFSFQWPRNIRAMFKLSQSNKKTSHKSTSTTIITLKSV